MQVRDARYDLVTRYDMNEWLSMTSSESGKYLSLM